jgi:hypothetical protein
LLQKKISKQGGLNKPSCMVGWIATEGVLEVSGKPTPPKRHERKKSSSGSSRGGVSEQQRKRVTLEMACFRGHRDLPRTLRLSADIAAGDTSPLVNPVRAFQSRFGKATNKIA